MPLQIYIAPRIGSGIMLVADPSAWSESTGPWRPLVHQFINRALGETLEHTKHPNRNVSVCLVTASDATLDAIEADARATKVLPIRATDRAHLAQILDAPFSAYPAAWRSAAVAFLESNGVNTEWITLSHTMSDILGHLVRLFSSAQCAYGTAPPEVGEFLKRNLDMTVGAIPQAERTAIRDWLESRGVDTSWVSASTTLRQIVGILPQNFTKLYGANSGLRFAGRVY